MTSPSKLSTRDSMGCNMTAQDNSLKDISPRDAQNRETMLPPYTQSDIYSISNRERESMLERNTSEYPVSGSSQPSALEKPIVIPRISLLLQLYPPLPNSHQSKPTSSTSKPSPLSPAHMLRLSLTSRFRLRNTNSSHSSMTSTLPSSPPLSSKPCTSLVAFFLPLRYSPLRQWAVPFKSHLCLDLLASPSFA